MPTRTEYITGYDSTLGCLVVALRAAVARCRSKGVGPCLHRFFFKKTESRTYIRLFPCLPAQQSMTTCARTPPSTGGQHDGAVRRREECRHRGPRVSALAPRTREQRCETVEPSRDGGSSRLFSPRRRVGTGRDLVAVAAVVEHPGDAHGALRRRAQRGSSRG